MREGDTTVSDEQTNRIFACVKEFCTQLGSVVDVPPTHLAQLIQSFPTKDPNELIAMISGLVLGMCIAAKGAEKKTRIRDIGEKFFTDMTAAVEGKP